MDTSLVERLQAWREESEKKLRKRWYLWPILFAVDLLWHRIYTDVNQFLDSHGATMLTAVTSRIPSGPVTLAIITALVIITGLVTHAYFETRGKPVAEQSEARTISGGTDYRNPPFHPRSQEKGRRIEFAAFGAEGDTPINVTDRVRALVLEGKEVWVNRDCLGVKEDPHPYATKYLTITLSATHSEAEKVVLPSQWLNGATEDETPLKQAPRFVVNYRNRSPDWEYLSFLNEGKTTGIIIAVGPLIHEEQSATETRRTVHKITMIPESIPSLAPGDSGEGKIFADTSPDSGGKLLDILRKGSQDSNDSVTITFEDGERHKFEQRFELKRQVDDSIRWDPGPVRMQQSTSSKLEPKLESQVIATPKIVAGGIGFDESANQFKVVFTNRGAVKASRVAIKRWLEIGRYMQGSDGVISGFVTHFNTLANSAYQSLSQSLEPGAVCSHCWMDESESHLPQYDAEGIIVRYKLEVSYTNERDNDVRNVRDFCYEVRGRPPHLGLAKCRVS